MDEFLRAASNEAERGRAKAALIGAVRVHGHTIIGRGVTTGACSTGSAVQHGEMDALGRAGRQPARLSYRASTICATLSPCAMSAPPAILLYGAPAGDRSARTGRYAG